MPIAGAGAQYWKKATTLMPFFCGFPGASGGLLDAGLHGPPMPGPSDSLVLTFHRRGCVCVAYVVCVYHLHSLDFNGILAQMLLKIRKGYFDSSIC